MRIYEYIGSKTESDGKRYVATVSSILQGQMYLIIYTHGEMGGTYSSSVWGAYETFMDRDNACNGLIEK